MRFVANGSLPTATTGSSATAVRTIEEVRRLVAEPERVVLVTTKEGEFARQILDHWGVRLADIQGKEAGIHKCENLRALIADYTAAHGGVRGCGSSRPARHLQTRHHPMPIWRTWRCSWRLGATTRRRCARPVRSDGRIRLLELDQFREALPHGAKGITGLAQASLRPAMKPICGLLAILTLPGHETQEQLHLHRWCQWISRYHPAGVYDGEEGKRSDYMASLPPFLLQEALLSHLDEGDGR